MDAAWERQPAEVRARRDELVAAMRAPSAHLPPNATVSARIRLMLADPEAREAAAQYAELEPQQPEERPPRQAR
jgi:hypothetical protein